MQITTHNQFVGSTLLRLAAITIGAGLIMAANLEEILEFGLVLAGGSDTSALSFSEPNENERAVWAQTMPRSQAVADYRTATWERKKLRFYYNLVSGTDAKAQEWLGTLHSKLERGWSLIRQFTRF